MRLQHEVSGEGPTLVLIGSLGSTVAMWDPQLSALAGFRVVRVDLPGHGGSPVPDAPFTVADVGRAVLRLLDGRFSVCGLSFGGMVAMWLAANADVDRVVFACTKPSFLPPGQWRERAELVRREGMAAIADAVLARWFVGAPPAEFRQMLLSCPVEGYARCCDLLRDADMGDELARIDAPALVIAGEHDRTVTPDEARALPGPLVTVDAAHLANVGAAVAFNAALLEHLA